MCGLLFIHPYNSIHPSGTLFPISQWIDQPSVFPSCTHPLIYLPNLPTNHHPYIHQQIGYPSINPTSIHLAVFPTNQPTNRPSIYSSVRLAIQSLSYPSSIHPSTHPAYQTIHFFTHPSIQSSIHPTDTRSSFWPFWPLLAPGLGILGLCMWVWPPS